jgi:hypothetical protein
VSDQERDKVVKADDEGDGEDVEAHQLSTRGANDDVEEQQLSTRGANDDDDVEAHKHSTN